MKILLLILAIVTLHSCARFKTRICEACGIIERQGDEGLENLKIMAPAELRLKDSDGRTPFYYAVYHGANKSRNLIIEKTAREEILKDPAHQDIITICAASPYCSVNGLMALSTMGFRPDQRSLPGWINDPVTCSTDKFDALINLKASTGLRTPTGQNLLHQLFDRGLSGRPKAPRKCLVHAIRKIRRVAPKLSKEKNQNGQTPLAYAQATLKNPEKWGSNIKRGDIEVLLRVLK